MEHSDRGRYVTNQVALWIANDGEHYPAARRLAVEATAARDQPGALVAFWSRLTEVLRTARYGSAAWHVAQELAPNDFARIDWAVIAAELVGE